MKFQRLTDLMCKTLAQDMLYVKKPLDTNSYDGIIKNRLCNTIMTNTTGFDVIHGLLAGTVENENNKAVLTDLVFNGATHII